jgi:dTMP kinase
MYKKKSIFITFEGIEGSGKSYQSRKLYKKIKEMKLPAIYTREPGGTKGAEKIRELILKDYFDKNPKEKFSKNTDTLLYLASRNEHIEKKIKPAIRSKKIIICDRFIDSTLAYQVYGKKVNKNLINHIHKHILGNLRPNLTILLIANISNAMNRLNKRKKKNRYDKFTKKFYNNVQKAFLKISKENKQRFFVVDNTYDTTKTEKIIFNKFTQILKND